MDTLWHILRYFKETILDKKIKFIPGPERGLHTDNSLQHRDKAQGFQRVIEQTLLVA